MKNILTLVITLCFAYTAQAQVPQIALQHNGSSSFYTSATTAMTAAQNGDTLYFPGGSFGTLSIDKQLVIYGTGIHPDSTSAVGVSEFGTIYFREGSSGSKIQGLDITVLSFSPNNQTNKILENINVSRCYIANTSTYTVYMASTYLDTLRNITFEENIIRGYNQSNFALYYHSNVHYHNIHFNKNIINYKITGARNTYFFNNIFLSYNASNSSYYTFNNTKDCYFFNNYFNSSYLYQQLSNTSYLENCTFNNNLFRGGVSFPYVSNFGLNNQINQTEANTFISVPNLNYFGYSYDYHLKPTSTGKNAGFDGTDIGIYGTAVPTQEGWMPDNPHIILKNIGNMPDVNGNLPVQVQTRAVDNQ